MQVGEFIEEYDLSPDLFDWMDHVDYADTNFHALKQHARSFHYNRRWTHQMFMQYLLLSGKYPTFLRVLGIDMADLHNSGKAGETVYLSNTGKSALVCVGDIAVAHQFSNNNWYAYDPAKGLNFPWIQNIIKRYNLSGLSTIPMPHVTMESAYGGYTGHKLLIKGRFGGLIHSIFSANFMEYEVLKIESPCKYVIRVWSGIGEAATVRDHKISIGWTKPSKRYDTLSMLSATETVDNVEGCPLKPIQEEVVSKLLVEQNPYTDGISNSDDANMVYRGSYIQVSASGTVWMRVEDIWIPLHRDAMKILEKHCPDSGYVSEYRMYENL